MLPDLFEKLMPSIKKTCDLLVIFFAGWTVLVWLVVIWREGAFVDLRVFSPVILILPLMYLWAYLGKDKIEYFRECVFLEGVPDSLVPDKYNYSGLVLIALVFIFFEFKYFWLASIAFFSVNYFRSAAASVVVDKFREVEKIKVVSFVLFSILCVLIAAFSHRPDSDDGFFINLAVAALDSAEIPLLMFDGTLDISTIPLMPAYRIHSFELFLALLAALFNVEPIYIAHIVLPPVMGLFIAFSNTLLLRVLLPYKWHIGCAFLLLFWLTMADPHEGYSNYGLVRIFQGKSILFTGLIPLLIVNTIRAHKIPNILNIGVLIASIISAVGLSSSGLFLAPLVVTFVSFALWAPNLKSTVKSALPPLCCLVLLPIALVTWHSMQILEPILNGNIIYGEYLTFDYALEKVYGLGIFSFVQICVLFSFWFFVKNTTLKKFILSFTLIFFLIVLNPFLYDFISRYVTSPPVFFRLFFLFPMPVFTSCLLVYLLTESGESHKSRSKLLVLALVVSAFLLVPKFTTLSRENNVLMGSALDLKVPSTTYSMARLANALAEPKETILAPRSIAMWVPTFRHHSKLVAMKENYLKGMLPWIGDEEFETRIKLFRYISGQQKSRDAQYLLDEQIRMHNLGVIIIPRRNPWKNEILALCENNGFDVGEASHYMVITRGGFK